VSSTREADEAPRRRSFADGLSFPELTLGLFGLCTSAYGALEDAEREAVIERAFELGVRSFDVAPVWGDSEAFLARVLGARVQETQIIARAGRRLVDGELRARFDEGSLRKDLEGTLSRLGRSQVDLLLLHAPTPSALRRPGESLDALRKLKAEGLIGAIGVTASTLSQAQAALDGGAEALAMPMNLLGSDEFDSLRGELIDKKVGFFATSPLLHGLLADQLSTSHVFPPDDHRSLRWTREGLRVRLRHVAALRYLVGGEVPNMAVASLRFILAQTEVTSVCLGPRTVAQLEELVSNRGEPPYLSAEALGRLPQILGAVGA
jgi:aryl-alcohol dehydrogenase-like predicted oxidoreductase